MNSIISNSGNLSPDEIYLNSLISKGETQTLDFKFAINDSRKIARSLVAFANTDGGTLLIGVKDNGTIAGIRSGEELYMVDTASLLYCVPEIPITKHLRKYEGKEVLEVSISKVKSNRLCAVIEEDHKEMVYIRIGSSNQLVNHIWIRVWQHKQNPEKNLTKFSDNESVFLKLFITEKLYSVDELIKITGFKKKLIEHFLIKFCVLDILKIHFKSNGVFYSQNPDFENNSTVKDSILKP